jgi:hypothetical protein
VPYLVGEIAAVIIVIVALVTIVRYFSPTARKRADRAGCHGPGCDPSTCKTSTDSLSSCSACMYNPSYSSAFSNYSFPPEPPANDKAHILDKTGQIGEEYDNTAGCQKTHVGQ